MELIFVFDTKKMFNTIEIGLDPKLNRSPDKN